MKDKTFAIAMIALLLVAFFTSCDTVGNNELNAPGITLQDISFAVGDSVTANAGTLIYKNSSGTGSARSVTEGTEGEITSGPENGYWKVAFTGNPTGWTLEDNLTLIVPDTTVIPPDTTTPPPDTTVTGAIDMLGLVSCSKGRDWFQALDIYANEIPHWSQYNSSGQKIVKGYGGGGISLWSNPNNSRWNHFDRGLVEFPETDAIVWEICVSDVYSAGLYTPGADISQTYIDMGIDVYNTLAGKTGATLYVVGTWPYEDGHVPQGDEYHDEFAQAVADTLISLGYFDQPVGFDRRKLLASELKDGKHVNSLGMQKQAQDTQEWFAGMENE